MRDEALAATQALNISQRALADRVSSVEAGAAALTAAQADLRQEVSRQADELVPLKTQTQRTRDALSGARCFAGSCCLLCT